MKWVRVGNVQVKLNLSKFMDKWGRALVNTMKAMIGAKRDINGNGVPENATSTATRKGFDHRGIETGSTRLNAFDYRSTEQSLTLFVSGTHPSGTGYDEIVYYNQPKTARVPGGAGGKNPGAEWFGVSKTAEEAFYKELGSAFMDQVEKQCRFHHTLKVMM